MSYRPAIKKYMVGRKRPQTADTVAKYFLITTQTARTHLNYWAGRGLLTKTSINGKDFFSFTINQGTDKN
jgi:predicted ArsR family transcriptional regulator